MKKFISTFFLAVIFAIGYSQSGLDCNNSISIVSSNSCTFQSFTTSGPEIWLQFIPATNFVNISLETEFFGENLPHIHYMALIGGTCSSPIIIADDELAFVDSARILQIDLNANVVAGMTYFIKILREGPSQMCNKTGCTGGGPATFDICVQNINVIIPLDLGLEKPGSAYAYLTNRGQLLKTDGTAANEVKLYTTNTNPTLFFSDNSVSYVFARLDTISATPDTFCRVDMTLVGGNAGTKIFKTEQAPGFTNYYLPQTPHGVGKNRGYYRTVTTDVYPNIDMEWYSNIVGEKFYFIVKPGGDPDDIVLKFEGATSVTALPDGSLKVITPLGTVEYEPPHAYRINPGNNIVPMPWQAKFVQVTTNSVKFETHEYDHIMPLFIQVDKGHSPLGGGSTLNPVWCTHYGGVMWDENVAIDSDNSGYLYVTGMTYDLNFPHTTEILTADADLIETFMFKFSPGGTPVWRVLYGGFGPDYGTSIKYDDINNVVYFGGWTSYHNVPTNFPLQNVPGAYNHSAAATGLQTYGYIVKFWGSGPFEGTRIWATLFGEDGDGAFTQVTSIDVSTTTGDLVIGGNTQNFGTFPIVTNVTGSCTGVPYSNPLLNDLAGFVAVFNPSNQLLWSTPFGSNYTYVSDVSFGSLNKIYITGNVSSVDAASFPLQSEFAGDYVMGFSGGSYDAFISKFNFGCWELKWSTLFGGSETDQAKAIVPLPATHDSKLICGWTSSNNTVFPILDNGNVNSINDSTMVSLDGFIAEFNATNNLTWSTYVGGLGRDVLNDMEVGDPKILYLTGFTESNDYVNINYPGAYNQSAMTDEGDGVIMALDMEATYTNLWSTYIGGVFSGSTGGTEDDGLTLTTTDDILYIGGTSNSDVSFPWNADLVTYPLAYYQPYIVDREDLFLAQFDMSQTPISVENIPDQGDFIVYPNPSSDWIYLKLDEALFNGDNIDIEVIDMQGRRVVSNKFKPITNGRVMINLVSLVDGLYVVRIHTNSWAASKKIIVSH